MTIEDAARATKIRPRQIADLEADEHSNFANLAYARSFFVGYAKFLGVDVRPYLEAFEDASTFGLDDYQYLSETPVGMYRAPVRPMRRKRRKRKLLSTVLTLVSLLVLALVWRFVTDYRRLGDLDKLAARQEARERAAREGKAANGVSPAEAKAETPRPAAETIPVSAPASGAPVPSPVPANDRTVTSAAVLAAAENATSVPVGALAAPPANVANTPAVPLPGDGAAARALTRGPDLHATLAGVPAGLNDRDPAANVQAKVRAAKPVVDPYQGNAPQPVANNAVR